MKITFKQVYENNDCSKSHLMVQWFVFKKLNTRTKVLRYKLFFDESVLKNYFGTHL